MSGSVLGIGQWRSAPLESGHAVAVRARSGLAHAHADLLQAQPRGDWWTGEAAAEASVRHTVAVSRLAALDEAWGVAMAALGLSVDVLASTERALQQADSLAHAHGLVVSPDGEVIDPAGVSPAAAEVRALLGHASQLAQEADVTLAAALSRAMAHLASTPGSAVGASGVGVGVGLEWAASPVSVMLLTAPRRGTSLSSSSPSPAAAADVVAWWGGLTSAERAQAVAECPNLVGATDGLPAWARDQANRVLLDCEERLLVGREIALRPSPDGLLTGLAEAATIGTFGGGARRVEYTEVVSKLAAIQAVRQVLGSTDGQVRQLLLVDMSGRDAKVAVSVGDLDRADHVAVLVDGFTTTAGRDLVGADAAATQLTTLARRESMGWGDRGDVATVTWMGYDAPQLADTLLSSHSVVLRSSAEAGSVALAAFLASVGGGRHLTLIGHSYGSTTAGVAVARGNTAVDDLVVMGSPGLGVPTDRLGLPLPRVHVLEADEDLVADLGWFGPDPDRISGVDLLGTSGERLPDGSTGLQSVGHSEYLAPGSTSQWNVAAVVAGSGTRVRRAS